MQLDLGFARAADGRTGLVRRHVAYPWALTRPFHLDDAPAGMATVVPQAASGGLYADDRLVQSVAVAAGAAAHVTSQGATVVNAGRDGRHAENEWRLSVAAGGWLEVINDPLVLFPDADLRHHVEIDAAGTGVYADSIGWHPEPAFRRYSAQVAVRRDGRLLALERLDIGSADIVRESAATSAPLGGYGLMLFLNVETEPLLATLIEAAGDAWVGIGTLPNGAGLAARLVAPTLGALPPLQQRLWRAFREVTTGQTPASRRKGL